MKKVCLILLVLVVIISIVSCGNSENANNNTKEEHYNTALKLIENAEYSEAYEILKNLGDYKDAKEKLSKFKFIPTNATIIKKQNGVVIDGYTNGYNISYNKYNLPQRVEEYEYLVGYGEGDFERTYTSEYIYNTDGKIINKIHKASDGDKDMYDYTYDARGNLIEEVHTDSDMHPHMIKAEI